MLRILFILLLVGGCKTVEDCKCSKGEWFEEEKECKVVFYVTNPCIAVYDPVCGCDNKIYENECVAKRNGIKFFKECKLELSY